MRSIGKLSERAALNLHARLAASSNLRCCVEGSPVRYFQRKKQKGSSTRIDHFLTDVVSISSPLRSCYSRRAKCPPSRHWKRYLQYLAPVFAKLMMQPTFAVLFIQTIQRILMRKAFRRDQSCVESCRACDCENTVVALGSTPAQSHCSRPFFSRSIHSAIEKHDVIPPPFSEPINPPAHQVQEPIQSASNLTCPPNQPAICMLRFASDRIASTLCSSTIPSSLSTSRLPTGMVRPFIPMYQLEPRAHECHLPTC